MSSDYDNPDRYVRQEPEKDKQSFQLPPEEEGEKRRRWAFFPISNFEKQNIRFGAVSTCISAFFVFLGFNRTPVLVFVGFVCFLITVFFPPESLWVTVGLLVIIVFNFSFFSQIIGGTLVIVGIMLILVGFKPKR